MTRVKRGVTSLKHRRNILKQVKGYNYGRGSKERQANEAIFHAQNYAFAHRRRKKGDFRRLWQTRIGAAVRGHGMSYSKFFGAMGKANIALDRKVLSQIAQENPDTFERIVNQVKSA